jgi:hypothetical protein
MKKQQFQIRYNTAATSDENCWRVIADGEEVLVDNIEINGHVTTTKDYIEDINQFKYHITCTGFIKIVDNISYIISDYEK